MYKLQCVVTPSGNPTVAVLSPPNKAYRKSKSITIIIFFLFFSFFYFHDNLLGNIRGKRVEREKKEYVDHPTEAENPGCPSLCPWLCFK